MLDFAPTREEKLPPKFKNSTDLIFIDRADSTSTHIPIGDVWWGSSMVCPVVYYINTSGVSKYVVNTLDIYKFGICGNKLIRKDDIYRVISYSAHRVFYLEPLMSLNGRHVSLQVDMRPKIETCHVYTLRVCMNEPNPRYKWLLKDWERETNLPIPFLLGVSDAKQGATNSLVHLAQSPLFVYLLLNKRRRFHQQLL